MSSRYTAGMKALYEGILGAAGRLGVDARRAAAGLGPAQNLLSGSTGFVEKVRTQAWKIGDEDIAALKALGHDEEQIYELTVATAFGEGWRRLERGLMAHSEAKRKRSAS